MAASHDLMSRLHERLTEKMMELLDKEAITAAELSAVATFLKNNDIRAMPGDEDSVQALRDKMRKRIGNSPIHEELDAAFDEAEWTRQ